jgi:hypothetical protein
MEVRIARLRVAIAALFVLAGVGLASLLSPLVGTALATAGQIVNVSDPANANTAKVDSAGKLYVGDGAGPLSVDGTVASRPAAPASPWSASLDIPGTLTRITGPSVSPINVTSLSLSIDTSGSGIQVILAGFLVPSSATSCNTTGFGPTLWEIRDAGDGVTPLSFTFPTPLQFKPPANTKACLYAYTDAPSITLNAVGFYGG